MSIVPAWYISHRLSQLSFSEYKTLYGGKKKQRFIALLVILQFSISIGLIFATLVANEQINLIKERAYCYENRIEIGDFNAAPATILKEELEKHVQGIESIALSQGSILNSWIRELSIKQADGTEKSSYLLMLYSDANLVKTMGVQTLVRQRSRTTAKTICLSCTGQRKLCQDADSSRNKCHWKTFERI